MKFEKTAYDGTYNILFNDHFVGKTIVVDVSGGSTIKAGSPLSAAGVVANDATAVGILLDDVPVDNPNGTIVIHGFIDTAKAQAHSGVTVATTAKTALPQITFC